MLDFNFSILECSNAETHVKQTKACNLFYKENREFERLKVVTAKEKKFRAQTKPKTVHQKFLEDTKSRFTADVKLYMKIAVNQVKIAGIVFILQLLNLKDFFIFPKLYVLIVKLNGVQIL